MGQSTIKKKQGRPDCQETEISKKTYEKTAKAKKWRLNYRKVLVYLGILEGPRKRSVWFKQFMGFTSCNLSLLVLAGESLWALYNGIFQKW